MKNLYKKRTFVCIGCGIKTIARRPKEKLKYCSLECYRSSERPNNRKGKTVKCHRCGVDVYKPKNILGRSEKYFCSQLCANKYQQETNDKTKMRENGVKSILSQIKNSKPTKLEIEGKNILNEIGICFTEQVPMFNKFIVDVLIENKKIVVQWDGEYWHLKKINKDRDNSQDKYLAKCGYRVLRYTDKQINKNREAVKKDIIKQLNL